MRLRPRMGFQRCLDYLFFAVEVAHIGRLAAKSYTEIESIGSMAMLDRSLFCLGP